MISTSMFSHVAFFWILQRHPKHFWLFYHFPLIFLVSELIKKHYNKPWCRNNLTKCDRIQIYKVGRNQFYANISKQHLLQVIRNMKFRELQPIYVVPFDIRQLNTLLLDVLITFSLETKSGLSLQIIDFHL